VAEVGVNRYLGEITSGEEKAQESKNGEDLVILRAVEVCNNPLEPAPALKNRQKKDQSNNRLVFKYYWWRRRGLNPRP